jgi:two-component system OmpR family sensor kinase
VTSLRRSALIWMTALLAIVGAVAVIVSYELAHSEAASVLDGQLRQIALNAGEGLPESAGPPVEHDPEDDFAIDIWNAAGERLRASPSSIVVPRQPGLGFSTIEAGGEDWRVYTSADAHRTVQVAQRMSVRREFAERAALSAAAPILIVIPLAWLVITWSLGRVLGQLTQLARTIAARGTDSKEKLSTADVPEEVSPLVEAMNVLIARLQHALDQQRRFVSDAAHELRTPLTALRLQVENLGGAANEKGSDGRTVELGDGIRRASTLLDQLLKMARFEAPRESAPPERLDLASLVTECMAEHVSIASRKGVDLGIAAREPAEISAVAAELKILFGNLIDNAVRYTPAGGTIDLSIRRQGAGAVVEVADTGGGVSESDLPRLFDRFFRAAPPKIGGSGFVEGDGLVESNGLLEGSGLGLAIVDAIARRNGIEVNISNRQDPAGLLVRVWFPAAS